MWHQGIGGQAANGPAAEEAVNPQAWRAGTVARLPQQVEELLQQLVRLKDRREHHLEVEAEWKASIEAMRGARTDDEWHHRAAHARTIWQRLRDLDQDAAKIREVIKELEQYFLT